MHYTWGALLCLVGLEQYIDRNPWEGLRFGALNPPSAGEFRGAHWGEHTYDVTIGPNLTELVRDGTPRFKADAGVVVREYEAQPSLLAFNLHSRKSVSATTMEFNSGILILSIDGKNAGQVAVLAGQANFKLPAGDHSVQLQTVKSGGS